MPKKRAFLIYLIVLVVVAGGLFYWWQAWQPWRENVPQAEPPRLFAKDDYQIEDRTDGRYIVIDKLGFSCKVPDNWTIEIQGDDYPEPEYFVNLTSPDAEINGALKQGCGISVMAGTNKERVKMIEGAEKNPAEYDSYTKLGYQIEIIEINNTTALKWVEPEIMSEKLGERIGLEIPIGEESLLTITTRFPPNYKEKCSSIWEELIDSIVIE